MQSRRLSAVVICCLHRCCCSRYFLDLLKTKGLKFGVFVPKNGPRREKLELVDRRCQVAIDDENEAHRTSKLLLFFVVVVSMLLQIVESIVGATLSLGS